MLVFLSAQTKTLFLLYTLFLGNITYSRGSVAIYTLTTPKSSPVFYLEIQTGTLNSSASIWELSLDCSSSICSKLSLQFLPPHPHLLLRPSDISVNISVHLPISPCTCLSVIPYIAKHYVPSTLPPTYLSNQLLFFPSPLPPP